MASTILFLFCLVCNLITSRTDNISIEDVFSFSIPDLLNNNDAIQSLSDKFKESKILHIPNILSSNALQYLCKELKESPMSPSESWSNAWQENKINKNYPIDHPINHMTHGKVSFVGGSVVPQIFIDIYHYQPLLQLFSSILSLYPGYSSLHLSKDPHGSVYGLMSADGEGGSWHFDQHPFSCVWALQQPLNEDEPQLRYAYMPPIKYENENGTQYEWDWDTLSGIYAKNEDVWNKYVKHLRNVNEGDVYCFEGNVTLHDIPLAFGEKSRIVFVTAYSEIADFIHDGDVQENNQWDKYDLNDLRHANEIHSVHVEL